MSEVCVISIYVPDIVKAMDFYTTVLGFKVDQKYGSKIVSLVNGELPFILEEKEQGTCDPSTKPAGVVLALKTEDIDRTVKALKEHGVAFIIDEPTDCPVGKFISFRDPFGNVLEYLQFGRL